MIYALYFIHILISIFLILVVLLQQGKGADLSVFGGGGTQVAFGARTAATMLHKITVTCFVLFLVTTLTLGIMSARSAPSVMSDVVADEPVDDGLTAPAGGSLDELDGATDDAAGSTSDAATETDGPAGGALPAEDGAAEDGTTEDGSNS